MTFARSRIDAHNAGDCDYQTCPLCDLELAEEREAERPPTCEACGGEECDRCDHGVLMCEDCDANGACVLCDRERQADIADDEATERALEAWRAER